MTLDPIALTQALIRQASVTPDDGRGIAVAKAALEPLGFTCYDLVFEDEEHGRVHNLYARIGTEGPHFCFAGHTDVVPPGNAAAWREDPYSGHIADGKLYGRGAEDMKAAIAAFISATAGYLAAHGGEPKGSISFLLTGDEEGPGVNGTPKVLEWLHARNETIDACLVGEPTNPQVIGEMVKIGRRGSLICEITVNGRQGHVAYPALADNPVTKIVNILHALQNEKLDEGTVYFPPSNLEVTSVDVGNPSVNVIPAHAFARFNIRFNDQHHSAELIEWIQTVARNVDPTAELKFKVSGEAFLTPPGPLSALLTEAIRQETGVEAVLSTTGGTSDARVIKDYCPVIEFGATGRTPHMVNEYIEVQDILTLTRIYRRVLEDYFAAAAQ